MGNLIKALRIAILTISLVGILLPSVSFSSDDIILSKVETLIVEKGAVNYTITVKAFVQNFGESNNVVVELVARDINGYELENITLNGFIKQGRTKVLVGQIKMSKNVYQEAVRWEMKK